MSETTPPPVTGTRIHDKDLAWDMAHAAKPHWEIAHAANIAAEQAQAEVFENYQGIDGSAGTNETTVDANPEASIGTEKLRDWVHNYKFYAYGTLDNTKTPRDKVIEDHGNFGPLGYKSLGTVPRQYAGWFGQRLTTAAAIVGDQFDTKRFNDRFIVNDITEKLTIQPVGKNPEKNLYSVLDPDSGKADERMVAFVYERNNTRDGAGRSSEYRFTLFLPQSEADIFKPAVAENPSLIREMVDIAMLEELEMGEGWNGIRGTANKPRGSKLAIRTDFAQGPEESLIVPFAEAA